MNRGPPPHHGARGPPPRPRIDRDKITPSLLRVFVRHNGHHPDDEFTHLRQPTKNEYQLYAWRDSTVRELLLSLRDAAPSLRANPLARYSLRLVFFDPQLGRFTSRELASVGAKDLLPKSAAGGGIRRTLEDVRYVVGDWVDIAYFPDAGPPGAGLGGRMNGAAPAGRDSAPHMGGGGPGGPAGFSIRGGGSSFSARAGGPPSGRPIAGMPPTAPTRSAAQEAWGPAPVPGGMGSFSAGPQGGRGDGRAREAGIGFGRGGQGRPGPSDGGWSVRGAGGHRDRDAPLPSSGPRRGGDDGRDGRAAPPHMADRNDDSRRRRDSRSRSPVRRPRSRSPPPPPRG